MNIKARDTLHTKSNITFADFFAFYFLLLPDIMISNIYDKFRRVTSNQLYFPEIDGIRFLAIILVIIFHTHGYFIGKSTMTFVDDPAQYDLLNTFFRNGDRGVELFFVLSGFILCLPFAHQYINNGKKVVLKKYYLRRVTRLEPPYILVMTSILLMHLVIHITPASVVVRSWLASLIYSHNLIYHHNPLLTVVAWSLEVEIQFYLLAPLVFSLLALNKISRRTILFTVCILLIVAQNYYKPSFNTIYSYGQYFLAGILLSDFYVSNTAASFFNRKWIAYAAFLCLITIFFWPIKGYSLDPKLIFFGQLSFPFLIILFYYIVMKNSDVKRIFSYSFMPIIGGMCYSIYLLHYTIISFLGRFTMGVHLTNYYLPNLFLQIMLLTAPVLIISSLFYLYVERPFMSNKWMDKLMKKDKHKEEINTVT